MFDEISLYLYPDDFCLAEPSDSYVWSLGRFQLSGKLVNKNRLPLRATVAGLWPAEFPILHIFNGGAA